MSPRTPDRRADAAPRGPVGRPAGLIPLYELGRGGMGRVLLAARRDEGFTRLFALKRLHPHLAESEPARRLFVREARLAGLLRNPYAVSVLEVGEDAEGPFLVMEYVAGVPLALLPATSRAQGTLPSVQLVAGLCAQAARGLHAAHELRGVDGTPLGLVHRDVSPQNVLVGFDGVVRVTDFGVARAEAGEALTGTGVVRGRLGYMAPERLRYEAGDRRADLFSLGVLVYELLTAERLYGGDDPLAVARRILDEPAPDIGLVRDDVPEAMVELLFDLLAKDPALRPPDAAQVAQRLEGIAAALAAEEGRLDVPAFVARWLEAERRDEERRTAEALAALPSQESVIPRPRRRVLVAAAVATTAALPLVIIGVRGRDRGDADINGAGVDRRYPIGFVWRRRDDWRFVTAANAPRNPAADARGRPVWHYEALRLRAGDAQKPWYARPTRLLVWDDCYFTNPGAFADGDDASPVIADGYLAQGRARDGGEPVAPLLRWQNPIGRTVHVDVTGAFWLAWKDGATRPATVAIARVRRGDAPDLLFERTIEPRNPQPLVPVELLGVAIDPGDSLAIALRVETDRGYVALGDNLAIVLAEGFAQR